MHKLLVFRSQDFNLEEMLKAFTAEARSRATKETGRVLIQKSRLWQSALKSTKVEDFDFYAPLVVRFSGEDAEDEGGPRREFLQYSSYPSFF